MKFIFAALRVVLLRLLYVYMCVVCRLCVSWGVFSLVGACGVKVVSNVVKVIFHIWRDCAKVWIAFVLLILSLSGVFALLFHSLLELSRLKLLGEF